MIQRYYGCDPGKLTMPQWFGLIERIAETGASVDGFDDKKNAVGRSQRRKHERRAKQPKGVKDTGRKQVDLQGGPHNGGVAYVRDSDTVVKRKGPKGTDVYRRISDTVFAFETSTADKISETDSLRKLGAING